MALQKKLNRVIFLCSVLGMILAAWMWSFKLRNTMPPCTLSGCSHVLTGEYSEILDVPVAAFGFFYYAIVGLIASQREYITSKLLDTQMAVLLTIGIIFTVYLRYLEFVKIGTWCEWCWGSVILIVVITFSFLGVFGRQKKRRTADVSV